MKLPAGVAAAVLAICASTASGATTIGQTTGSMNCGAQTVFQTVLPGVQTSAPSAGVITSWSYDAAADVTPIALKVARPAGGTNLTMVGTSELVTPAPVQVNTFPVRIPVQGGDLIGLYLPSGGRCGVSEPTAQSLRIADNVDRQPGDTSTYQAASNNHVNLAATMEPDADGDGFGDESQDLCPGATAFQEPPCDRVAPETTIVKAPPKKSDKRKVKLKFTSSEPGSSFECRLDKGAFKPCSSPRKLKPGAGKHRFKVRAVDAAGNVDPTPAKAKFRLLP